MLTVIQKPLPENYVKHQRLAQISWIEIRAQHPSRHLPRFQGSGRGAQNSPVSAGTSPVLRLPPDPLLLEGHSEERLIIVDKPYSGPLVQECRSGSGSGFHPAASPDYRPVLPETSIIRGLSSPASHAEISLEDGEHV